MSPSVDLVMRELLALIFQHNLILNVQNTNISLFETSTSPIEEEELKIVRL